LTSATAWSHTTVLLVEATQALLGPLDGVYLDATFGRGGHCRALLERLEPGARLIAIDRDRQAVEAALQGPHRIDDARFSIHHAPFSQLGLVLQGVGVSRLDGLLLDLGVSSPQIDDPQRGFSFRFDAPLDMRMDTTRGDTAAELLVRADEHELARLIREYGEERFASRIAREIVARRDAGMPLQTTRELAQLVARCVKTREAGQDPATRTFQALRIAVNGELGELEAALAASLTWLAPEGRLAVISFHSLEDRIVKTFIARESRDQVDRRAPFAAPVPKRLRAIARIKPGEAEVRANPRARSAVLRVAQRTEVL
jgi:16S rRNA (cytosine1402-N4)-methyltransferase